MESLDWRRLKPLLDEAAVVVFARDLEGRYLYVNRTFERLVGMSAAQVLGRTVADVLPPEVAATVAASDREAIDGRRSIVVETQGLFAGARRSFMNFKFPLLDGKGRPAAVMGIGTESTERRAREDALQAASLAVSSGTGDRLFQELTRYLAMILNVRMALIGRLTGKRPRTIRTLGIYGSGSYQENIEYQLDVTPCRNVMRGSFTIVPRAVVQAFPEDHFLPAGAEGYAGYPLLDSAGRVTGVIAVLTSEPIADAALFESVLKIFAVRAAAELERHAHEEALAASEASYRGIFEGSEDAIFIHDYDTGAILDANPKACATFGYTREEIRRLTVGELAGNEPPYTDEEALRLIGEVRAGKGPLRFEWRRRNKDGTLHWDEVTLKKVDIAGRPHVMAMARQITEHKNALEALKASEEQYRAIFNASADSLVLRDAEFRVVDVNPAYEAMSGRRREEALGRGDLTMSPPELNEHVKKLHARALAGEPVVFEALARRKDGSRFNIETRGVPILHQGRPHVLYIGRDITARKSEEDLLRANEEQYRAIFDASADALVLWDSDMRRVDVNAAYEQVFGYTREEALARGYDEQVRPVRYDARRREILRRTLAGERCQAELESVRKDGSPIFIEVRTIPIRHRGRPHVLSISRDITDRKRAEAAVRASEERYRLLFEMDSDAILLVDADTLELVDLNPVAEKLWGYGRDELLRMKATDLSAEPAETSLSVREGVGTITIPLRWHRKKDGTVFPVEITANRFELEGRRIVQAAIRDISERQRAEAERAQLEAQLRQAQKMEAIGHLTGGIAHDFNNILQSILGNLTLAAERAEDLADARLARYVERAQLSAQRARELIQQMLTFSRGKRGEPRLTSPSPLVEEAAKLLRPMLPATIELELDLRETAPVRVDRVQAEQVLLNLCINARDAMRGQGTIALSVREAALPVHVCTACRQRFGGRFVEMGVADTGPGISPEVVDRMFEPFFSTKEVGKGSGMGLSMVHGIVHEHGGHVLVDTAPGAGAVFRVLLPVAGGDVAAEKKKPRQKAKRRLAGSVLVVDDEETILEFMGDLLGGWGLDVTLKSSAVQAKHAFAAEPQRYDLVLTDHTMPRLTGLELARQIRAIRPGTPVILYTGYGEHIADAELAAAGVRALARKPLEPAELLALLTTHLQQIRNTAK